ncbi:hypothetical protein L6E12_30525 [Actinokineospora sp. PR83]|uniref:hypothetical protein n=1 Tax=Actinokineospora sp. PR83 TaxID=2884908 RepID=UPI001F382573|nr:hypothetical protein [Actinokineospora sp. PR83]MCG8920115.1 hypothetical protein [Actinokineospora sp. PR83]
MSDEERGGRRIDQSGAVHGNSVVIGGNASGTVVAGNGNTIGAADPVALGRLVAGLRARVPDRPENAGVGAALDELAEEVAQAEPDPGGVRWLWGKCRRLLATAVGVSGGLAALGGDVEQIEAAIGSVFGS